jgi:predicted nucleic acid-binding Zn ribbon protein
MERAGRLIARLKLPAGSVAPEGLARAAWPPAVGKRIAAHTRAVSLTGSYLVVEVEDAIWQRQLFTLKSQILKKLEEITGQSIVSDIEFRVAVPRRLPQRAERLSATQDDADQIQDPVLRRIYKQKRKRDPA